MNSQPDPEETAVSPVVEGFAALAYTDPVQYSAALEKIWRPSWQFFCPVHRLEHPGDVMVGWLTGVPVLVVRGLDGALNGFLNVCPHRAHPVAEKSGNCKVLTCRYHTWSFGLDGSFRGAPSVSRREIAATFINGMTKRALGQP